MASTITYPNHRRTYPGSANLVAIAETRRAYVAALQAAGRGDIGPLMAFAQS